MKFYAGIGSRQTPEEVREKIHEFAKALNDKGYTLRSGGADGADTFFEEVADRMEIFLPWPGFNKRPKSDLSPGKRYIQSPSQEAVELAQEAINGYDMRPHGPRMLLARNMHQILGENLDSPVEFVICWTYEGIMQGGTAHGMRLAKSRAIPVYNLGKEKDEDSLRHFLGMHPQKDLFR